MEDEEESSVRIMKPKTPKRRRNRETKACWPCRDRKVKCDMSLPCDTCRRRKHTDLCRYGPRSKSEEIYYSNKQTSTAHENKFIIYVPELPSGAASPSTATFPVDEASPESLDTDVTTNGFHQRTLPAELIPLLNNIALNLSESLETDNLTKNTTFLGRNSSATFFRRLGAIHLSDLLPQDVSIESAFGLTNRTTLHPFGSLWTTVNVKLSDVLQALPELETCMRYYRSYQQTVKQFYPFLLDPDGFEQRFLELLRDIEDLGLEALSENRLSGCTFNDAAWYGLLFSVLASGCQYSDTEPKERVLRTRVFVVCAFECLRLANLYVLPSVEVIQCGLFLEITLANDCNPGVANTLLGVTVQQAQELGLHVRNKQGSLNRGGLDEVHPLWRAIIFLDSVLSTAYDRKPTSFLPVGYNVFHDPSHSTASSFHEIMWAIHALKLNWQKTSAEDPSAVKQIEAIEPYINALEQIEKAAEKTFFASRGSTSIQGRLEELVYTMYLSCFKAKLTMSACLSKSPSANNRRAFFEHMTTSLREVVKAFLGLKRLSPIAIVSWDILHRAMTCALLLGGIETVMGLKDSLELLGKLTRALASSVEAEEAESEAALMILAPFRHALDTLTFLLNKRRPA